MPQFCVFEDYANICKSYPVNAVDLDFREDANFCHFLSFHDTIIMSVSRNRFLN